jgi:hypothetical protein
LPTKGKHSRRSGRRNPTRRPGPRRTTRRSIHPGGEGEEVLRLVREGVEKFILKDATVEDFLKTIRAMTEKGNRYSHPLTSKALLNIIKEVTQQRIRKRSS